MLEEEEVSPAMLEEEDEEKVVAKPLKEASSVCVLMHISIIFIFSMKCQKYISKNLKIYNLNKFKISNFRR